jgi:hypothetical protein
MAADSLANQARRSPPSVRVPSTDLYSFSRKRIVSRWNRRWAAYPHASHYRSIQPTIPSHSWFSSAYFPRHLIVSLIRLRLDHSRLPASLFRRHIVPSPDCSCAGHPQADLNYLLFSCPHYSSNRCQFYSALLSLRLPTPFHSSSLLLIENLSAFPLIYSFLMSCDILV